jgi:hypothetical protein
MCTILLVAQGVNQKQPISGFVVVVRGEQQKRMRNMVSSSWKMPAFATAGCQQQQELRETDFA